jgi:hypothetical protein
MAEDILTFAGVRAPGMEDNFSDFYETTFMETSGRTEVDLYYMAIMLLRLAKAKGALPAAALAGIQQTLQI